MIGPPASIAAFGIIPLHNQTNDLTPYAHGTVQQPEIPGQQQNDDRHDEEYDQPLHLRRLSPLGTVFPGLLSPAGSRRPDQRPHDRTGPAGSGAGI